MPFVLDFAPTRMGVAKYFLSKECRYFSSFHFLEYLRKFGIHGSLEQKETIPVRELFGRYFEQLEGSLNDKSIGVILTWDYFNYLTRQQIIEIMAHLSPLCLPGAKLIAYIVKTKNISISPKEFDVTNNETVEYIESSLEEIEQVSLPTHNLISMMPSFRQDRMFASKSGIIEIVLEFNKFEPPPDPNSLGIHNLVGGY